MKRRLDIKNQERQLLEQKLNSLTKGNNKKKKQIFSQFDASSNFDLKRKKRRVLYNDDPTKSIYEKYRNMWKQEARETEDNIFNKSNDFVEEKEEDDFFLDPSNETHRKLLKENEKLVKEELNNFNKSSNNSSGFLPYENKSFWGAGGEYQPYIPKKEKVKYGKNLCTPTFDEILALDPKNWKQNVNFIPISKSKNKLRKILIKKSEKEQKEHISQS